MLLPFPESLRWVIKMEGENEWMREEEREDAGRWKQMSTKDEDEQMLKI